ncbi:IAA-amino acid conjugate hydrolase [Aureococcus anophagefferens]|nr:IAA-amino acid conjugate hydrolase [Aureococcus anophagefferens]
MLAALLAIGCAVADDVPVVVLRTPAAAKMAAPSFEELWNDAGDHMPWVVETRRELHRMPELLFDEHMTSGKIASVLASLGVNFTTGWAVEEGALKRFPPVRAAFGFHQWPFLPLGVIGGRPGPMLAATELFGVLVSAPHRVVDPIVAAAHVVTALQSIASRETDPLSSAVVSVTMFHAGDAYNVIPAGARRRHDPVALLRRAPARQDRVDAVVLATAAAHR